MDKKVTSKRTAAATRQPNLRERVHGSIRERIRTGVIRLEDRLVDHDIAKELHVSRMPVREALMQLKHEGVLEGTSRGFVLRQFTLAEIKEIFEIRTLLKPQAAAAASQHADPKGLAEMKAALEQAEVAHLQSDFDAFMRSDARFRPSWLVMVPNRELASTILRYIDHVQVVRLVPRCDPQVRNTILNGMHGLCEAFLSSDSELVRVRMLGIRARRRLAITEPIGGWRIRPPSRAKDDRCLIENRLIVLVPWQNLWNFNPQPSALKAKSDEKLCDYK